jgi:Protein of unknown function (DUF1553)/Protein of unknown function (DUF1549)
MTVAFRAIVAFRSAKVAPVPAGSCATFADRKATLKQKASTRSHGLSFTLLILFFALSPSTSLSEDGASLKLGRLIIEKLTVEPNPLRLHSASRQQQLLITAHAGNGHAWDVTRAAKVVVADSQIASVSDGVLSAQSDGATEVVVALDHHALSVPIFVDGCHVSPPVHFANDIVPTFSKLGCNGGGCHGRVQGQNGFKLSVFGFDPKSDYEAIVDEGRGRRLFPSSPRNSLLLQKAIANVPHGGGQRLIDGSIDYHLLHRWIEQGMPIGNENAATLERLEVIPHERLMPAKAEQQILATAIYSDGSRRDVSQAAQYASNASSVAEVNSLGIVRCGELSGEAAITVNYMGKVSVVRIQRPRTLVTRVSEEQTLVTRSVSEEQSVSEERSPIDRLVQSKLAKMGIVASGLAEDTVFLRRLYLDVVGTLPDSGAIRRFLNDSNPDKRTAEIDVVLARPEYADYLALKWSDILLVDKEKLGDRGAFEFHRWLRDQFQQNRPYDQWVREVITATGNSGKNGPVNLYRAADTPDALARTVSQAFLGVRLECAQCHHHPFDTWSQVDFYGIAGFFHGLERRSLSADRTLLFHAGFRPMTIPVSNVAVATKPLGESVVPDLSSGDPRAVLADWLVSPKNPWFARMFANRVWKQLFGRGLVEPEDDMRMTNPATNEPLLDYLTHQAIERQFDQKAIMRLILNSRVYQTSSVPNQSNHDDDQNFSHFYPKRLPAEVLLDAISQATGVNESFPGQPRGTRALQLWDNRLPSYFLEIFGRPPRNSPCECGRSSEPTMAQALHLTNAPEVESKIASPEGRVAKLFAGRPANSKHRLSEQDRDALVEELCLVTVGRPPNNKEMKVAEQLFIASLPRQAAEDFLWTLLNSYDFLFIQ